MIHLRLPPDPWWRRVINGIGSWWWFFKYNHPGLWRLINRAEYAAYVEELESDADNYLYNRMMEEESKDV